ncbi:MAG TPA: class I SAM-dependent methyltransferase [Bacteroidetes bacterium]|nr:class I SAM-dependent methyltransferase [Bacteroidota bacterium]
MAKYLKVTGQLNRFFKRVNELTQRELNACSTFYQVEMISRKKSAEYIWNHMANARLFTREQDYWNDLMGQIPANGLLFEFGVYKGRSINYLAEQLNKKGDRRRIYGFDSFLGMPNKPRIQGADKNRYDLKGIMPVVLPNVNLVKGRVEDTFFTFMENLKLKDKSIAYIHFDFNQYEVTKYILEYVLPLLKKGTIIDFDELLGYVDWHENEFKAMMETIGTTCEFEHVAFCEPVGSASSEIKSAIKIKRLYTTHR